MSAKENNNSALVSGLSGICGSSFGKFFVHPIDTIKAKLQVQRYDRNGNRSIINSIFKETMRVEGIKGLYRGFGISLFGSMPAAGLYFGSYEFFKKNTLEYEYL